jgi:hypothetical protein
VGKTSTGAATAGIELNGVNDILRIARDGGVLQELNRITSNGDIIEFRKDNSPVGSIGVDSGDNLYISASAANHAGIYFSDVGISAMQAGSLIDASVDLGTSSYRFKDLYLSGTATMGGLEIGDGSAGGTSEILFSDNVSARGKIVYDHSSNPETLLLQTTGSTGISIDNAQNVSIPNGNVGIGKTAPNYLLHLEDSNGADLALGNSTVSPSEGDYLGRIYALDSTDVFFAGINMFYLRQHRRLLRWY